MTDEHTIGKAFQESLPFTALLVVFFSVVAVIIDQKLFAPIIHFVLASEENTQLALFYIFNGLLSSISDNVFVATVYINEAKSALANGVILPHQFELLFCGNQYWNKLTIRRNTKWTSSILVLIDLIPRPINSPFLRKNGLYGFALYRCYVTCRFICYRIYFYLQLQIGWQA